jgi:hypothetical protein
MAGFFWGDPRFQFCCRPRVRTLIFQFGLLQIRQPSRQQAENLQRGRPQIFTFVLFCFVTLLVSQNADDLAGKFKN